MSLDLMKHGLELQAASVPHIGIRHKQELQKAFDAVAEHLMKQKRKCVEYNYKPDQHCTLINDLGERCALGCLLPKDWTMVQSFYLKGVDFPGDTMGQSLQQIEHGYTFIAHKQRSFIEEIKVCGYELSWAKDRFFLGKLQAIHDSKEPEEWYKALAEFAFNYGLDQTKLYAAANANA